MADVLVLGAGMVGIGTALALQDRGHKVLVVDRRAPGTETSHGNAGVIQAEAYAPYAMPRDLATLWKYALGRDNDLLYDLTALPGMARALWSYFRHSSPHLHARLAENYAPLVARATRDHAPLVDAAGAEALIRRTGLGEVFETEDGFQKAAEDAEHAARSYGLLRRALDGPALCREESVMTGVPAGAVIWEDSWSCSDPGALVAAYAALFSARGGDIECAEVSSLTGREAGWVAEGPKTSITAEHVVVALGPWSPGFLKPLGYRIPMVAKRGYHGHFKMEGSLSRPYFLADHGTVASEMSRGLRLTTGAHLTHMNAPRNLSQLHRGHEAAKRFFPLGAPVPDSEWQGTRPCLPEMMPLVGAMPGHRNLWVNFGHGHHGFTLGPTTGALLASVIDGEDPALARPLAPKTRL